MFDERITDSYSLAKKSIIRDGFVFVSVTNPTNIYDGLLIKVRDDNRRSAVGYLESDKTLQEHIAYFNNQKMEKAYVITDDLAILKELKTLKYLTLVLHDKKESMDFTPLYDIQGLKFLSISTSDYETLPNPINCLNLKTLEFLSADGHDIYNLSSISNLKTLLISNDSSKNLYNVFGSENLDTLLMSQCKLRTLDGIEMSKNMRCLYLYYNRCLEDIGALRNLKHTLRALRIENCAKIKDFSVLYELDNLEHLLLWGNNVLPNLNFVNSMKNLKTFVFNFDVLDGDLSVCKNLSYVYSGKNRKHFNMKDKDLPKGIYFQGNDSVESWRKYE